MVSIRSFLKGSVFAFAAFVLLPLQAFAQQMSPAPSVHLRYPGSGVEAAYVEVNVKKSAPNTYFEALGWQNGYFGIQELTQGRKQLIFSVWDSGLNDPSLTPQAQRASVVTKASKVTVGRFGDEGSGAQTFLPFTWKNNTEYAFKVTAKVVGSRAEYSGWYRTVGQKQWNFMATLSTPYLPTLMTGLNSFIEDFGGATGQVSVLRQAIYANQWVRLQGAAPTQVLYSTFTSAPAYVTTVDSRVVGDGFELITGGSTANLNTPNGGTQIRQLTNPAVAPAGF
jgi:hypothetical protein